MWWICFSGIKLLLQHQVCFSSSNAVFADYDDGFTTRIDVSAAKVDKFPGSWSSAGNYTFIIYPSISCSVGIVSVMLAVIFHLADEWFEISYFVGSSYFFQLEL
jgi:hypothetical protein